MNPLLLLLRDNGLRYSLSGLGLRGWWFRGLTMGFGAWRLGFGGCKFIELALGIHITQNILAAYGLGGS